MAPRGGATNVTAYIGASYADIHDVSLGSAGIHWVFVGSADGVIEGGFRRANGVRAVGS
jgi:hypothetical protein